ncbi:DUF1453 family protein [Nocardia terpenica]|uniref:DUF1453 domain-containing protein n=1 Tax=Nocardia terpenica TaxID=455432 RepID=A0A164NJ56_9NOCA|nr:CcdC protein domain-containing protein [Nocardia terpenica]KZM74419.1 hypothetical protein AWN90_25440 [Nocardia terpenica]MBF6059859.1 DUF1453 family protein [Nocardia terpenica]MBF6102600.1 DUF1453 family protein [Nocardia terpenica]MBF6111209.1 DUF1453 family protein [Nocardia terpenica]MBF6117340.1 DUF1453 family protein [Nocardia terpenica]
MTPALIVAAVAIVVIVVIIRRFAGEPLNAKDLFVPPIVLLGIGVYILMKQDPTGIDIAWICVGLLAGFCCGALRGTTIRLLTRDGVLWQRYTPRTLAVWVLSVAVTAGVSILGARLCAHADMRPTQLSIGVSLLGEALVIGLRALSTGHPFAPEKVAKTRSPLVPISRENARPRHR